MITRATPSRSLVTKYFHLLQRGIQSLYQIIKKIAICLQAGCWWNWQQSTMRAVKRWIFMGFSVWILLFIMAQLQFYIHTSLPNPLSRMDLLKLRLCNPNISKDTYRNPYNFSDRILSELSHSVDQSKVNRVCDPEVEGWPPQRLQNFCERYLHPNK